MGYLDKEPDLIRPLTPLEALCLRCALPECDETDPRCAYQQATGRRSRRLKRLRSYMRRRRAEEGRPAPG